LSRPSDNINEEAAGCLEAVKRLITVIDGLRIDGRRIIDEPSTSYAFALMQVKQILTDASELLRSNRITVQDVTDAGAANIFKYERDQLNAIIDWIEHTPAISMEKAQHSSKKGLNSAYIIIDSLDFVPGIKFVKEFMRQIENLLPS
jgi:hypothetical protein